jgi:hypothetical protein
MKEKRRERINADVEVVVVPGESQETVPPAERKKIQKIIRDNLLLAAPEPYHKVQVEVERRPDGKPQALIASMLRAETYTADIVTVSVDPDYHVRSIRPETKNQ